MGLFVVWVILSALVALLGRNRNIGYGWSFALCVLISPLIGLIITLLSKKKEAFVEISNTEEKE